MNRKWPLLACAALVALLAIRPGGHPVGWRQASEGNGYRSDEYGLFGVTFYQTNRPVVGLHVAEDFRAALASTGLTNPPPVEAQADRADRTLRRDGTQYWLRIDVKTKPKDVIDAYARQIAGGRRMAMPSQGDQIDGLCPDGKTHARVYAADLGGGKTDVSLTFGPGS